jgi:hypothetical protein
MGEARRAGAAARETFGLGWLKAAGANWDLIGAVTLPSAPGTLGEARGGLEMVGDDAATRAWLLGWAAAPGETRDIVLELPGGWYVLHDASVVSADEAGVTVRFDRRYPAAPAR